MTRQRLSFVDSDYFNLYSLSELFIKSQFISEIFKSNNTFSIVEVIYTSINVSFLNNSIKLLNTI